MDQAPIGYELQPKFTVMESSIRGVSIFWKLSWGLENDNTLFKNDNVCLCWSWSSVILCLTAQVIQCISYERSKRQNLFFINRCVVMVAVWQPFWFWHLLIFRQHFVFHGSTKLSSRQHYDFPNKRISHRFLQNHCFICVFFFWIQPCVPNDNPNDNETITKKSQNPYRPDTGPWLAEKLFFLAHVARPRWVAGLPE